MTDSGKEVGLPKYDFRSIEVCDEDIRFREIAMGYEFKTPPPIRSVSASKHKGFSSTTTTVGSSRSVGTVLSDPLSSPCSVGTSSAKSTPFSARCKSVKPSVISAIVEGRGYARGEVGMASLDLKKPELILSQFSDTQTYIKTVTKLKILHPLEIIMPHTTYENGCVNHLAKRLNEYFPCAPIVTVHRRYFSEVKGLQYIKHLRTPECTAAEMELTSKYYCLASVGALIKYVEYIQNVLYAPNSLKVVFTGSLNTTMIDVHTSQILELAMNLKDPQSEHSLYGVLHAMQTIGGSRFLRANILQPPCDMKTISDRLDCISEMLETEEMLTNLKVILGRFPDVDHILSLCIQIPRQNTIESANNKITYVIYLKHALELVEPLRMALENFHSELLKKYYDSLNDPRYAVILAKINEVVHDDTKYQKGSLNMRAQKCFAVKPNINGLLDVARRTYAEAVQDVAGRCVQSLNEIYLMSNIIITKLLNDLIPSVGCLYSFAEIVSTVDMLVGFAQVSALCNYVRPDFTDTLAIKGGRHPILDRISSEPPMPNNTYVADGYNFVIITGPNMSGKSTYLKQVALLQIMAQIGCFVPAEYASFRLANHIFSRKGSNDDIESNSSTFMIEMTEINYILRAATNNSLIIIDELGRGTSVEEGTGICWAVCAELCGIKAFTLFATHFMELTYLDAIYANVCNYHLSVTHEAATLNNYIRLHFSHTIAEGPTSELYNGIRFAELVNFPKVVIKEAMRIAGEAKKQFQAPMLGKKKRTQRVLYWLNKKLLQVARNSSLITDDLQEYMNLLKGQYLAKLAVVEEEKDAK